VSSVFDNGRSEGYSPSQENGLKDDAPVEMIEEWRQAIPASPGDPEIGAASKDIPWEGREPDVWWESYSAIAEPRHHAKIQAWWKACIVAGTRAGLRDEPECFEGKDATR
jgi:hypothetical protein